MMVQLQVAVHIVFDCKQFAVGMCINICWMPFIMKIQGGQAYMILYDGNESPVTVIIIIAPVEFIMLLVL